MLHTTNYNLNKIELADAPPDITVLNKNWDTLDTKLKTCSDADAIQEGHRTDANVHLGPGERLAWNGKADGNHKHDALYAPITHSNNGDAHVLASDKVAWNGKANGIHNHTAEDITGGVVGVDHGGTGKSSLTQGAFLKGDGTNALISESPQNARNSMGLGYTLGALPIANGGTGGVSSDDARLNLGAAPSGYGVGEELHTNAVKNPLNIELPTGIYGLLSEVPGTFNLPESYFIGQIEMSKFNADWQYVKATNFVNGKVWHNSYSKVSGAGAWIGWHENPATMQVGLFDFGGSGEGITLIFPFAPKALLLDSNIITGANATTNKSALLLPSVTVYQDIAVTGTGSIRAKLVDNNKLYMQWSLTQLTQIKYMALA
ncbi:MAG: hypothetical protein RR385_06860 [Clostridiales bacterium]